MLAADRSIAIQEAALFLRGARARGLDVDGQLVRFGIAPASADGPHARVSIDRLGLLLRYLCRTMRDELLGLGARPVPAGTFALAVRQMLRSATLADALRSAFGVYRVAIDDFRPCLRIVPGAPDARIVLRARSNSSSPLLDVPFLYWVTGVSSWLVQQRIPVSDVVLRGGAGGHSRDECDRGSMFGVPIRPHEGPNSDITIDARWLAQSVVADEAGLQSFLANAPACLLLPYRHESQLGEQVRLRLHSQLGGELPSLEQTARALRLTPHSLRRRLSEAGKSFQEIKNELRRDAAIKLLRGTNLKLDKIALQLGFSECSTFHRSFRLWTGHAPGAYRRDHALQGTCKRDA